MTLTDRIKLIDDLIKENPDVRICDYIEALTEIKGIIPPSTIKPKDIRQKAFTSAQELFIFEHHAAFTAKEISFGLSLDLRIVFNIARSHQLKFKAAKVKKKPLPIYGRENRINAYVPDKPKEKMVRPPAIYNNIPLRQNIL